MSTINLVPFCGVCFNRPPSDLVAAKALKLREKAYVRTLNLNFKDPVDNENIIMSAVGMLGPQQRRTLYLLARDYFTGRGVIIDGGSLVGASTLAFACGVAARKDRSRLHRSVITYDRFSADPDFPEHPINRYLSRHFQDYRPEQGFRALFERQVGSYMSYVDVREDDFLQERWDSGDIEILFCDICKSKTLNSHLIEIFFPYLKANNSIIVHQDYHHPFLPWIHVTMQALDDYLEIIEERIEDSILFRLKQMPPPDLLQKCIKFDFSFDEQFKLMDAAISQLRPENRDILYLTKVMLTRNTYGTQAASAALNELCSNTSVVGSPTWPKYLAQVRGRLS